jgi:ABC-2 type transport system ATP-binding protein/lipopolysaccharide transport system ATP-binding protein
MASIEARDVSVDYQIYTAQSRSFKTHLFRSVGGAIRVTDDSRVIISALKNVTLSFKPGDRVALIGGNGAGKSTLLKIVAGILEPTAGSLHLSGRVSSLLDMSMGMDLEATGYENIIMRSVFLGATFAQAKARIPAIEEFSELGEYLQFPMRTYSTGMSLRLSFAIATSIQPQILVLDEMISAGDAAFAAKARARMKEIVNNLEILVLASHDMQIVKSLCTRAVVLSHGTVLADTSVDEALANYERMAGKEGDGADKPASLDIPPPV